MVIKKKIIQKGGLQNETFTEYFNNMFELLKVLSTFQIKELNDFNEILKNNYNSDNILFKKLLHELEQKIPRELNNKSANFHPILKKIKGIFYIVIFTHIVNFIDNNSFISKLLNIYIYMLFINYLILLNIKSESKKLMAFHHIIHVITTLIQNKKQNFGRITYNNIPHFNSNQFNNMTNKVSKIKNAFSMNENKFTREFLGKIKTLFIEQYSRRVPIFYGNDYVGNLSKKNKKYIINPVGAFILKLYNSDIDIISRHKRILPELLQRLRQLLQSVIGSDRIPNLKYLDNRTEFCIIKEQNHEKICEQVSDCSGSRFSNFFTSSLYGNRMIAEITEENIASDEHILELLDILLNLFLENNEILKTNINRNEVQQFNLSQRRPKTLSNQRRRFAEGAQSIVPNNNNNFE